MSLIDRIKSVFRRDPPVLRNRAGGMAWIKSFGHDFGADVLAGRIVKTVIHVDGCWEIDPPQCFVVAGVGVRCVANNFTAYSGDHVMARGLADDLLEPIPEVGDDVADESKAWLPPVPRKAVIPTPCHHAERSRV